MKYKIMHRDIFKDTVVIEEETGMYLIIERINDSNEAYGGFDRETSIEGWKTIRNWILENHPELLI